MKWVDFDSTRRPAQNVAGMTNTNAEVGASQLTLSLLMLHICGVSKTFGEWYQKANKTEDTNKLTLFVSSGLFILWYHSPNILDTPHIWSSL
jgi:hypothetical protein